MAIFTSQMYGKRNPVEAWGSCANCGRYGKRTSYNARRMGAILFIPLFNEGPPVRVVNECMCCSRGVHIPEAEVPPIISDLTRGLDDAVNAILAGRELFYYEGVMAQPAASLGGIIETIHCLDAEDLTPQVLGKLQKGGMTYEYHVVNADSLASRGLISDAGKEYMKACDCKPSEVLPLLRLGELFMQNENYQGARASYEKAIELSDDRLGILEILIAVYEALGDHEELSGAYEECFALDPELASEKKIVKAYRKACANAGRLPDVL